MHIIIVDPRYNVYKGGQKLEPKKLYNENHSSKFSSVSEKK